MDPITITLTIKNTENIVDLDEKELKQIADIVEILVTKGCLTRIRGGSANIHFNGEGEFMGVQLDYWPWRKRKIET